MPIQDSNSNGSGFLAYPNTNPPGDDIISAHIALPWDSTKAALPVVNGNPVYWWGWYEGPFDAMKANYPGWAYIAGYPAQILSTPPGAVTSGTTYTVVLGAGPWQGIIAYTKVSIP